MRHMQMRSVGRSAVAAWESSRSSSCLPRLATATVGPARHAPAVLRRPLSTAGGSSSPAAPSDQSPGPSITSPTAPLLSPPPAPLFVSTRHHVTGRRIVRDLGLVAASAVRSRNLIVDVMVAITRVFGGETPDYTMLLNECTEKATLRLEATARAAGATAVVGVRYATTTTMNRMIVGLHCTVLASGTAVIDEPEDGSEAAGGNANIPPQPLLRTPHSETQAQAEAAK